MDDREKIKQLSQLSSVQDVSCFQVGSIKNKEWGGELHNYNLLEYERLNRVKNEAIGFRINVY